jgi:hypothetical protein
MSVMPLYCDIAQLENIAQVRSNFRSLNKVWWDIEEHCSNMLRTFCLFLALRHQSEQGSCKAPISDGKGHFIGMKTPFWHKNGPVTTPFFYQSESALSDSRAVNLNRLIYPIWMLQEGLYRYISATPLPPPATTSRYPATTSRYPATTSRYHLPLPRYHLPLPRYHLPLPPPATTSR